MPKPRYVRQEGFNSLYVIHYNLDGEPTVETVMTFSVLPKRLNVVY